MKFSRLGWPRPAALTFACALAPVAALPGPAQAQAFFRPFGGMYVYDAPIEAQPGPYANRHSVAAVLARRGFDLEGPIERRGESIVAHGYNPRLGEMRFVIDAYEGEVVNSRRVGPPAVARSDDDAPPDEYLDAAPRRNAPTVLHRPAEEGRPRVHAPRPAAKAEPLAIPTKPAPTRGAAPGAPVPAPPVKPEIAKPGIEAPAATKPEPVGKPETVIPKAAAVKPAPWSTHRAVVAPRPAVDPVKNVAISPARNPAPAPSIGPVLTGSQAATGGSFLHPQTPVSPIIKSGG